MQKLARIIDLLNEDIFTNKMKKTVLLIDDLDRQWADERIRIKLIEALINALPKFRKIENVKILVAMRDDLLDVVLEQANTSGFQRDKFQDSHRRISWKAIELQELVDRRVAKLFKKQYTQETVALSDLFEETKGGSSNFEYVLDRTIFRPRDILAYLNLVFDRCGGKNKITLKDIRSAEFDYSKLRRQGLVDEWRSTFPFVDTVIGFLGHRKLSATFRLGAVAKEPLDDLAVSLYASFEFTEAPIILAAKAYFDDTNDQSRAVFLNELIQVLYRIGVIGVRTQQNSKPQFSFI